MEEYYIFVILLPRTARTSCRRIGHYGHWRLASCAGVFQARTIAFPGALVAKQRILQGLGHGVTVRLVLLIYASYTYNIYIKIRREYVHGRLGIVEFVVLKNPVLST